MQYHTIEGGHEKLRADLIARGKKVYGLRRPTLKVYTGLIMSNLRKRFIDRKKVMIDYQSYTRQHLNKNMIGDLEDAEEEQDHLGCCRSCRESRVEAKRVAVASQSEEATFSGYYRINADTERLTDHQYMLFTNRVPAFYFQDREWGEYPRSFECR